MDIQRDDVFVEIAKKVSEKGGKLYIVGGAVRDLYLNKEPHDIDYCVTGINEETLKDITHVSRVQGSAFPVLIINGCEVALARKERKTGVGHKKFEIITDTNITIKDDLARRDTTINSMAIDVLSGELIDPFNGLSDLKNGIIRHTTKAFLEDPLRVYRVARFASQFGFKVSEETINLMHEMKEELSTLSKERVFAEFRKALLSDHPEVFFEVLKDANVLDVHFKEIADLVGVEQPAKYHPEGDAFVHTMEVLQKVAKNTPGAKLGSDEELTRFGALVHDFGKGATPREEWPHHYGHEERGIPLIHELCKRIGAPRNFEKAGKLVSNVHMKAGRIDKIRPGSRVKLFEEINKSRSISFKGVEIIARADSKDETIKFADIAKEVFDNTKVTDEMKEKCTNDGILDYEKLKVLLMQKRVEYVKKQENTKGKITLSSVANMKKGINNPGD